MNFSAISDYDGDGRYMQRVLVKRNISKLTFRPEDTVLDVGCGTGEETNAIAGKVWSVTGIDASEEMLSYARKNNPAPNVTYGFGDARTLDNPDWREAFDKAVSFLVLNWIADHAKAMRSIFDCLKPGGQGLFIVCNRTPLISDVNRFLTGHVKWSNYGKGFKTSYHFWNRSVSETEELLASGGWTNVQCELQHHGPITKEQTKSYMKSCLGMSERIPEADQEEYLEDLWQWALSRYEDETEAGHVRIPAEMIVIHACKPVHED